MVERWHQLPLDHALSRLGLVRDLVQALADRNASAAGRASCPVPDLGPAVAVDQLRVMAYDACALAQGCDAVTRQEAYARLEEDLATLRRAL